MTLTEALIEINTDSEQRKKKAPRTAGITGHILHHHLDRHGLRCYCYSEMTRPAADRSELVLLVAFDGSMEEFAKVAGPLLGLAFGPSERLRRPSLWADDGQSGVGAIDAYPPPPYDRFDFLLDFWTKDEHDEHDYARAVFEKLKALGLPMMLFANGCDIELDRFDPPSPAA